MTHAHPAREADRWSNDPDSRQVVAVGRALVASEAVGDEEHPARRLLSALVELTKPGITRLVTLTAGVGFALSALGRESWPAGWLIASALGTGIGVYLSAAGANALNQYLEHERDGVMRRTHDRPLPTERVSPRLALFWGITLLLLGIGALLVLAGAIPAMLSLACAAIYVLAYTPMKTWTVTNTLVGTLPGSIPPMIGAAAASEATGFASVLEPAGVALFILMTVWQIPHFLAIAWLYRDDYARAGYRMLPIIDPTGRITAATTLLTCVLLVPAALSPVFAAPDRFGLLYGIAAVVSSLPLLWLAVRFLRRPADGAARTLFIASIIQLPLLLLAAVADAALHAFVL